MSYKNVITTATSELTTDFERIEVALAFFCNEHYIKKSRFINVARNATHNLKPVMVPFLFVHIAKTAGTSFAAALSANFDSMEIAPFLGGSEPRFDQKQPHYRLYPGHYSVHEAGRHFKDCIWLTFLRHPISRAISQYRSWHDPHNLTPYWVDRIHPEELDAILLAQRRTFEEFIYSENPHIRASISNFQTRVLCSTNPKDTLDLCFPERLADDGFSRNVFESAGQNLLSRFAFFGLFEHFVTSLSLFDLQFGPEILVRGRESRLNVSRTDVPGLSQRSRGRLEELNKLDLALYQQAALEFERRLQLAT